MNCVFDYFQKKEKPSLILCNPYLDPLYSLNAAYNIDNTLRYNNLSEVEFDYPKSPDNGKTILQAYDRLKTKMVVLIDKVGYYIIIECPEDSTGMIPIKHVVAQSLESELLYKRITLFKDENNAGYKFYDTEDLNYSLMSKVLDLLPGWKMDYVDPDLQLSSKRRSFDIDDSTVYNFLMTDVENAYGCVFIFDALKRYISAYALENLNDTIDTYFSFNNISQSISLTEYADELTTTMSCYGGDDETTIAGANPLGNSVIYNFDYFKTSEWMEQNLIDALNSWENRTEELQPVYASDIAIMYDYIDKYEVERADLEGHKNQLAGYQTSYTALLASGSMTSGSSLVELKKNIKTQKILISKQNEKLSVLQGKIDNVQGSIDLIINGLQFTGVDCWQNFITRLSSVKTNLKTISKDWQTVYKASAEDPEFDLDLFNDSLADINKNINFLNASVIELIRQAKVRMNSYWTITKESLQITKNLMSEMKISLLELYDLFSALIPNTLNVTVLITNCIIQLETYLEVFSFPDNFTEAQYTKLQNFIYENTYKNSTVKIVGLKGRQRQERYQSLYNQSLVVLERASVPRYEFQGDFINFLYLPEYKDFISKIDLGRLVTIELGNGERIQSALLEIKYTYDNPTSFEMVFSNRIKLNKSNFKFADLFISSLGGGGASSASGDVQVTGSDSTTIINNSYATAPVNLGLYLKLDASNAPVTGDLEVKPNNLSAVAFQVSTSSNPVIRVDTANNQFDVQAKIGQSNANPLIAIIDSDNSLLMGMHSDDKTNVFIGYGVGLANNKNLTTYGGRLNTFIGYQNAPANTGGRGNTSLGAYNLTANISGDFNTSIGVSNLERNIDGISNVAVGNSCLEYNTSGNGNIAIGVSALEKNVVGDDNIAIGYSVLTYNETGNDNIAMGEYALGANVDGAYNVAIGYSSMISGSTGDGNVALGSETLKGNWANYNTAVGYLSMYNGVCTGGENTAIGSESLSNNTSGSYNVAVGVDALGANTTGTYNVGIGTDAGQWNNIGKYNTYLGGWSGGYGDDNNSILLGYRAGHCAFGIDNTFIVDSQNRIYSDNFWNNSIIVGKMASLRNNQTLKLNAKIVSFPDVVPLIISDNISGCTVNISTASIGDYIYEGITYHKANIVVSGSHGFSDGDSITIAGATVSTALNGNWFVSEVSGSSSFLVVVPITTHVSGSETGTVTSPTIRTANLTEWQEGTAGSAVAYVDKLGMIKSSGRRTKIITQIADYTANINDEIIRFTSSASCILPPAVGSGQTYTIIASGSNTVVIEASGSEIINGALTLTISGGSAVTVYDVENCTWETG